MRPRRHTALFALTDLPGACFIARFRPDLSAATCLLLERWAALVTHRSWS